MVDALGLDGAYGIGHSAGGADLLLTAPRRPHAFARLLLIEPTVMDPDRPVRVVAPAPDPPPARTPSRRATFPSHRAAFDWLEGRGIFAGWQPQPFDAFINDGFELLGDGHVTLRCTPEIEQAILRRLVPAIEGTHPTGVFEHLNEIRCPVLIATTEHSNPRFARMAEIAQRHLASVTIEHLEGVGHAVAQVAPERIASLARHFWDPSGDTSERSAPSGRAALR